MHRQAQEGQRALRISLRIRVSSRFAGQVIAPHEINFVQLERHLWHVKSPSCRGRGIYMWPACSEAADNLPPASVMTLLIGELARQADRGPRHEGAESPSCIWPSRIARQAAITEAVAAETSGDKAVSLDGANVTRFDARKTSRNLSSASLATGPQQRSTVVPFHSPGEEGCMLISRRGTQMALCRRLRLRY